ncbi:MAG: hypothetical protein K0S29_1307 [Gammaproteobacteria bacterium]|jgi:hypothetical protein|nr:hypothetical protein [Gammaproteobacteria bacterium]
MLAKRRVLQGHLRFEIIEGSLVGVLETGTNEISIPSKEIKYIPTELVKHLLPANKDKFQADEVEKRNRNFIRFLSEQPFKLAESKSKVYSLEFSYSGATYYGQLGVSLGVICGSIFAGPAAPVVFSAGTSMLLYSVFQPCQDLDWGSFALEGTVGAVSSVVTMGVGEAAKGAHTAIKGVKSIAGKQTLHFVVNGATSVVGQVSGAGVKSAITRDAEHWDKVKNPKALISTVVAGGAGGFAGAVAGKASVLPDAVNLTKEAVASKASVYGLVAGAGAGSAGAATVTIAWNGATGKELTDGLVQNSFNGAIAGGTTGSTAAVKTAGKAYNAKLEAQQEAKRKAEEEEARLKAEAEAARKKAEAIRKEAEAKRKAAEAKKIEDAKLKEAEAKRKEAEAKLKEAEAKRKEAEAKIKEAETKRKEAEAKLKEAEAKSREEARIKEAEERTRLARESLAKPVSQGEFKPDAIFDPHGKEKIDVSKAPPGTLIIYDGLERAVTVEKPHLSSSDRALLYINGMETSLNDAKSQARALSEKAGICVALKHNPGKLSTAIDVVGKNPKLPFLSSLIHSGGKTISDAIHSIPFVHRQSREFEDGLIREIQAFVCSQVDSGKRAHLTSFSLGNIYTYLALEGLEAKYRQHVTWISVASPIRAHDFKTSLGLLHVEMINAKGDIVSTFGGSIKVEEFVEGLTHSAHDFVKVYLHRVADAVRKYPHIFRRDIGASAATVGYGH